MKRKHLVAVGAIIAIVLLLYWLFIAEDLNAWLNVNAEFNLQMQQNSD